MTRLFLSIHDFLCRRKGLSLLLLLACVAGCLLLALRLDYKEDVADFLPQDADSKKYTSIYNALGDNGQISVIFRSDIRDPESRRMALTEALELFEQNWNEAGAEEPVEVELTCRVEDAAVFGAMDYLREHIALFLQPEDYRRMDSLLALPGYVESCLHHVKRMVSFPMAGVAREAVVRDPLNLYAPVLQRLSALNLSEQYQVEDDFLFDSEGNAYAFVHTPYPTSDTRHNALLAKRLEKVITATHQGSDGVRISAVGASLIAVTNATRIKKDSLLSMVIAIVLIIGVLWVSMGRKRNILWIAASVLFGWLFALGVMALFNPEISIIVIGIGSVLVGIAVNYPLHFLDHIREYPDRRAALKEMSEPLVTGNITTVSAFACLAFVRAEAMRDLGLFGALLLVGCILFVMVFLPLYARAGASKPGPAAGEEAVSFRQPAWAVYAFLPLLLLTGVLAFFSTRTAFDSDLHHINYMTAQQRADLDLLGRTMDAGGADGPVYVAVEAEDLESALQRNEQLWDSLGGLLPQGSKVAGIRQLIPSMQRQQQSLAQWEAFRHRHLGLAGEVTREAVKAGFTPQAFHQFTESLQADYEAVPAQDMEPLLELCSPYLLHRAGGLCLISLVQAETGERERLKAAVNNRHQDAVFAFDASNVGNRLVEALNHDFNYILYVCGFVVFFFLWLSLGRLELALLSFLPVGWLWILGLMDIFAVKFNIVNIILATFIFGQGDDYTIFITEGLMYEYAYGKKRLRSYRRSVIISGLLMFIGIGTLIIARHPAMRSLAEVALIGMVCVVLMACYLPPLVYRWMVCRKGRLREVPVTIKRLAYTFFTFFVFFVAAFVVVTPYTLVYKLVGRDSEAKRLRFHRMINRFSRFAARHLPGVDCCLENPEGEDFSRPAVMVANHQSHLDLLCILMLHPKLVIMTNDWVWRNPVYGLIIRYAEFYPVSNGYDHNFPKLQQLVQRGYSVMVFPEGTRSMDGRTGRFHKGAFQLAQQLGVDLLPVLIHGAEHVMPKPDLLLREGTLTVRIGSRIPAETLQGTDARQVASTVRQFFVEQLREMRREKEDAAYFAYLVRHQYLYKGRSVARRCRQALRQADAVTAQQFEVGQGEQPLLLALSHPEEEFHVVFEQEEDYLLAKNCALVPANLHYSLKGHSPEKGGAA